MGGSKKSTFLVPSCLYKVQGQLLVHDEPLVPEIFQLELHHLQKVTSLYGHCNNFYIINIPLPNVHRSESENRF